MSRNSGDSEFHVRIPPMKRTARKTMRGIVLIMLAAPWIIGIAAMLSD